MVSYNSWPVFPHLLNALLKGASSYDMLHGAWVACLQVGGQEPRAQRVGGRQPSHELRPPQVTQLPQEARRRALQLPGE